MAHIGDLVTVEWVDSHYRSGWTRDNPDTDISMCISVGWLIHSDSKCKVLSANAIIGDTQRCGDMTIPASAVRRIRVVRKCK